MTANVGALLGALPTETSNNGLAVIHLEPTRG